MILSSLPDLPGRTFDVRGFVHSMQMFAPSLFQSTTNLNGMLQTMIGQAQQMSADAIVDIRTRYADGVCIITGTAVRLQ